eukprot:3069240-Rhodomonas_salina.1
MSFPPAETAKALRLRAANETRAGFKFRKHACNALASATSYCQRLSCGPHTCPPRLQSTGRRYRADPP